MFSVFLVLSRSYYLGGGGEICNSHNRLGEENVQLVGKVILVTLAAVVVNSALTLLFGTGLTQAANIWGKDRKLRLITGSL